MSWFRKKMWLAIGESPWWGWIDTPLSGADAGTMGWGANGTLLNGGGYALNSGGTHKRYTFEWSGASARESAQFMQDLRSGVYGRGLIHFVEPTIYDTNILPARWAAPTISLSDGGAPIVRGVTPTEVSFGSAFSSPPTGVRWDLSTTPPGYRGNGEAIYVPIPDGYTLAVGAVYTTHGRGRYYSGVYVNHDGTDTRIPPSRSWDDGIIHLDSTFSGFRVARIWIGRTSSAPGSVVVSGIVARLIPSGKLYRSFGPAYGYGDQPYGEGPYGGVRRTAQFEELRKSPWVGGMGNSGVRFNGTPSMTYNTGVNGGQVGYAASFIETGSWGR